MKLHNGNVKLRRFETDRFLCFNEPEWKLESNWIYLPFAPQNCHIINDFVLFGSDGLSLLYLWAGSCANDVQTKSVLALNKKLKMNLKFQFFIWCQN